MTAMSENKQELLPCPFCGSHDVADTSNGIESCMMHCLSCGAEGPTGLNFKEASELWNRRAVLSASAGEKIDPGKETTMGKPEHADFVRGWNACRDKVLMMQSATNSMQSTNKGIK